MAPVRVSVPTPALESPFDPASVEETDTDLPVPSALTVIVGVAASRVRMFAPLIAQEPAVATAASPKIKLPMVLGVSRVITVSAVISLANVPVNPEPSAMIDPVQFVSVLHVPVAATADQVPSKARAEPLKDAPIVRAKILRQSFLLNFDLKRTYHP